MNLKEYVAEIQDFPKEGILFRDVTPLLQNPEAYRETTRLIVEYAKKVGAEIIVGPDARGFLFGCPVATEMGLGFVPVRKPGKLPRETVGVKYDLEYGSNEIYMHVDGVKKGQKALIIDDLLATGGTAKAACELIEKVGGVVAGLAFVVELVDLPGREILEGYDVYSVLKY